MTNQISTFNFKSNPVRIELIQNEPHFGLADVCIALHIENSRRVSADMLDQKGVRKTYTLTKGGKQELTFINEPNLYRIIFKSRKAEAVEFQNWVFEEVLPQIRKTGSYSQAQQLALPEPEPQISKSLTERQWLQFASHWFALYNMLDLMAEIEAPLKALGSRYASTAYTHAHEYVNSLRMMKRILEPMLAEFDIDPSEDAHIHLALKTLRNYQVKGLAKIAKI
ncbi:hypothetical protein A4G18_00660 [Pasteurellaceae bacterium Pebbles2]|nr:hypothetical protein [Pasteurellaceae bacterium Pebbles2]